MGDVNQDPSMEDILASIKRVIAEDGRPVSSSSRGARAPRAEEEVEPAAEPDPEEDILELNNPISENDGLMSTDTAAASRQSLAALASMREPNGGTTGSINDGPLEAVVKEMLRPMLKDWLDQRLPEMVEDLVAREIARITGKSL